MDFGSPVPVLTSSAVRLAPEFPDRSTVREDSRDTITRLLEEIRAGSSVAEEELLPLVYSELHDVAERYMRAQNPGHTLQATALVNEALLKIFREKRGSWEDRAHFLAFASHTMRSVLVDCARAKARLKRAPAGRRVALDDLVESYTSRSIDLEALDEALEELAERDPRMVSLVELRFFGGRTMAETAEILGMPLRTAEREWKAARAWLRVELE